ncbi:MAG: hypothetical protein RIQ93_511 [Verrucomicrobiota bacterium]|jgi:hypothetical protein
MPVAAGSLAPDFIFKTKIPEGLKDVKLTYNCGFLQKAPIKHDFLFSMQSGVGDAPARGAFVVHQNGVLKCAKPTATPKDLPNFVAVKAALAN